MTKNGRRFLKSLASQATKGCFLEIGPLFGSSTQAIDAGRRIDAPIHTIDTFEPAPWVERRLGRPLSREAFDRYTGYIDKLVVHEGFAPDIVRDTWSDAIGFYFDDATHGDPGWTNNFDFFSQFFTSDAIVCGDDFAGGWPDITHNVTRIAREWGVGLYVFGRVWAMTRDSEERIVAAATDVEPALAGATLESAHGPETAISPAMVWSRGLHQYVPLSSFRLHGGAVESVRFVTRSGSRRTEYDAGEWVHLAGISQLSMVGPPNIGFQICFAKGSKTENTKLFRPGEACRVPERAVPVALRLGMA
jgi:hypothetical protein